MDSFEVGGLGIPLRKFGAASKFDAIVCGGGPAGCAAALAAARSGLRCLLVECSGQLGGMGTSGLVSHWLGGRSEDASRWVVGGVFKELVEEAAAGGFALIPRKTEGARYQPHGWHLGLLHGIPFDPWRMASFLDGKMAAAGVETLLAARAVGVKKEGSRMKGLVVAAKDGLSFIEADVFIDASGDADLAFFSGCETVKGREGDSLTTPATLMMHVDNVDQDALSAYIEEKDSPRFRKEIEGLREKGEWDFPCEIFISVQLNEKGVMMINTSRLCEVDGCDSRSISKALVRGRAESVKLFELMRRRLPGFAKARISAIASSLGVRETRRIKSEEWMTVAALLEGRSFPGVVGYSSYGWDLPDPKRPSFQPMSERKVEKPPFTPIPYGIMLPRGAVGNLVCPGRAVGVERDLLGPLRVMAPCMAMGEAAGVAAALALKGDGAFASVDVEALRAELGRRGAIVDEEAIA